jgi:flavin reductase (DIM6/NTAB) family NADH-FMN oxidoreductase RutF
MAFDSLAQRKIMGRFATGIAVVTMSTDGGYWGMTANAVSSLSLDPPLVLVAVGKQAKTHGYLSSARRFVVNILSADQETLSRRFATDGPKDFSDVRYATGTTGAPILEETLGYVECELESVLPGGDHDIFVGRIVAGEAREGHPLLYFSGKYGHLAT